MKNSLPTARSCPRRSRGWVGLLLFAGLAAAGSMLGATAQVLILHTNDLHDHLRPGVYGQGGLPYVAGYIAQVRAERPDVLVLDAGDVTEKGDMVAFKAGHRMTYEALRRIGYDAVTIGNHDYDAGVEALHTYEQVLGQSLVCLNFTKPDGTAEFTPSRVVKVGGLRIGIIGMIVPQEKTGMDFDESGRALAREAERLRPETDLLVALCHESSAKCARWSRLAPLVDVFVSGHSHELLTAPVIVPGTGARIVQAGYYARWVGRLELTVDLETKKVVQATGEVIPLMHDRIPVDAAMLAWVRQREQELCPEADDVLMDNPESLTMEEVGWLGAAALRRQAQVDVGFCHAGQIIRSPIFAGPLDVNALFLAGGDRANANVRTELTGAEIEAYLHALGAKRDPTCWSGFRAVAGPGGSGHFATDLEPARSYTVIMPAKEWETRFLRAAAKARDAHLDGPLTRRPFVATPAPAVSFTDAMRAYVEEQAAAKRSLKAEAARLAAAAGERPAARAH